MPSVLTKRDFVRRFLRNEFGNRTRTWDTLEEFLASGYMGLVHIRNRIAGGPTYYNIAPEDLPAKFEQCLNIQPWSTWYLAEMAPNCTIFQGEIQQGIGGYDLTYSLVNKPMREALRKQTLYVHGLRARLLMEHYLDPGDWDWIKSLMDEYENHVVEFSTYAVQCGTLDRTTVVWEVRKY